MWSKITIDSHIYAYVHLSLYITPQDPYVFILLSSADAEALPKVKLATSQPEAVNYMHLRRASAANHEPGFSMHRAPGEGDQLSDVYFTGGC